MPLMRCSRVRPVRVDEICSGKSKCRPQEPGKFAGSTRHTRRRPSIAPPALTASAGFGGDSAMLSQSMEKEMWSGNRTGWLTTQLVANRSLRTFPENREENSEFRRSAGLRRAFAPDCAPESAAWWEIPCSTEQRIFADGSGNLAVEQRNFLMPLAIEPRSTRSPRASLTRS